MLIEKGTASDIDELVWLYNSLIDHLTNTVNYPGWIKGIYPVRDTAAEGVKDEALFVIRDNGKIAGTIILRHDQEPSYLSADWHVDLADSEILVVYTFAVHPMYLKKGIGKGFWILLRNTAEKQELRPFGWMYMKRTCLPSTFIRNADINTSKG